MPFAVPSRVRGPAHLQPADLRRHRGRGLQWARRTSLLASWLLVVGVPLWHLRSLEAQGAGLAGGGRWAALASALGLPAWAPPVVGAPGAVRLLGLELLDPAVLLSVALSGGASLALLWAAVPGALLVLLLGRFFCGWVCPYVPLLAASHAARALLARAGLPAPDVALPRASALGVLAVLLAASAVGGSQLVPLVYPPAVLGREVFRAVFFGGLGAGALLVAAALAFDTFVSRAGFCRYLCPGGALFRVLGALSPLRVERRARACTGCSACDVACNLLQQPMSDRLDAGCERCGRCIASCPTGALRFTLARPATRPEAQP